MYNICMYIYIIYSTLPDCVITINQSFYIEQRLFKSKNTAAKCTKWKLMYNCRSQNSINIALKIHIVH